jgi:hypothetical protein
LRPTDSISSGDVLVVDYVKSAGANEARLLLRQSVHVALVTGIDRLIGGCQAKLRDANTVSHGSLLV